MLITDYLKKECIIIDLEAGEKEALISKLAEIQFGRYPGIDREEAFEGLTEREAVLSTGIGNGIAIPHARLQSSTDITVSIGLVKGEVDFEAIDHEPVKIIFLVFFPKEDVSLQIRFLARISRLLTHTSLKENLLSCRSAEEVIDAFRQYEAQHFH